jgi:thiosulfate dehydrogenase
MSRDPLWRPLFPLAVSLLLALLGAPAASAKEKAKARHPAPAAQAGGTVIVLCDGETSLEVATPPGQPLERPQAQEAADTLMEAWRKKNPTESWDPPVLVAQNTPAPTGAAPKPKPPPPGPTAGSAGASAPSGGTEATPTQEGHTYGAFSERDRLIWQASVDETIEEGNRIFHDAKRLGGTVGVSCDMCHPNAANTHPETYPKYQVQLGRTALLRDMINWCVENPVRGKPLADDSTEMRALEAFIYAQRKGVPLEYGKH